MVTVRKKISVVIEGDYSDWAVYDSFDDAYVIAAAYRQLAIVNRAETAILLIDAASSGVRKYTIATKTLGAIQQYIAFPYAYSAEGTSYAAQGTYVVMGTSAPLSDGIGIWKNGDLIKSFTLADLGLSNLYSMSISRTGKYIIVSGNRTATGNDGWVILVGS